jgi:ATP-binding cassette subfamily C protein
LAGLFEGIGLSTMLPILTLASGSAASASPINQAISDVLAVVGLSPTLGVLLTITVGGIFLKGVFSMIALTYMGYAGAAVATRLRRELIRKLLTVRWSYFKHLALGRVANSISVDATRTTNAYIATAVLLKSSIETVAYITVALLVSWKLAVAALIAGSTIALMLSFLVSMVRKAGRQQTQRTSQLVTYVNDILNNIKPLKAMGVQRLFTNLVEKRNTQLNKALQKQVVGRFSLKYLEEFLAVSVIAGGFFVAHAFFAVPVSEFIVVGLVLFASIRSVGRIQNQYQKVAMLIPPVRAVEDLIAEAEADREPNPGTRDPVFTSQIDLQNVSFSHDTIPVLDSASMTIPAGEVTVITGSSGTGKTTITDLVIGLYQPTGGAVLVDGLSLREIDLEKWRHMVGYVPQELILLHDTILANVTLGDPKYNTDDARRALEAAGAWGFVSTLPDGLETQVGDKGARFSGGQRQRIAIARALIRSPKLLIMDEVTSALDPETERDICANIAKLTGTMTVLAISHRAAWIELADRVYRLQGAKTLITDKTADGTMAHQAAGD